MRIKLIYNLSIQNAYNNENDDFHNNLFMHNYVILVLTNHLFNLFYPSFEGSFQESLQEVAIFPSIYYIQNVNKILNADFSKPASFDNLIYFPYIKNGKQFINDYWIDSLIPLEQGKEIMIDEIKKLKSYMSKIMFSSKETELYIDLIYMLEDSIEDIEEL